MTRFREVDGKVIVYPAICQNGTSAKIAIAPSPNRSPEINPSIRHEHYGSLWADPRPDRGPGVELLASIGWLCFTRREQFSNQRGYKATRLSLFQSKTGTANELSKKAEARTRSRNGRELTCRRSARSCLPRFWVRPWWCVAPPLCLGLSLLSRSGALGEWAEKLVVSCVKSGGNLSSCHTSDDAKIEE